MMGVLSTFILLHMVPKMIPFPFFVPIYLGLMLFMIYANSGKTRGIVVALLAFQMAPIPLAVHKEFANIEEWANKGPNASPLKGAYLFDGLMSGVVDFSHCLWDSKSRVASCHLPKFYMDWPTGLNLTAAGFEITADVGKAGPGREDLAITMPWQLFWFFYHVAYHNRIDFHFDETLTEAQVYDNICFSLTAPPSPLAILFPHGLCTTATINNIFRRFTIVKSGDTWYRNTYFTPNLTTMYDPINVADKMARSGGTAFPATMQFGDGYRLLPLATPNSNGKTRLHAANIAKAMTLSPYVIARDL